MEVMLKNSSGTQTSAGLIPHLQFRGIRCPVKLMVCVLGTGNTELQLNDGMPIPMFDRNGNYLYALPNGGQITKSMAVFLEGRK